MRRFLREQYAVFFSTGQLRMMRIKSRLMIKFTTVGKNLLMVQSVPLKIQSGFDGGDEFWASGGQMHWINGAMHSILRIRFWP